MEEPRRHGDTETRRHGDTELEQINQITERIIGCAIEVHRVLRCGLFESVYRSAMAIEFGWQRSAWGC